MKRHIEANLYKSRASREIVMSILSYIVSVVSEEIIRNHFARFEESFSLYCDKQLLKINTFYSGTNISI